MDALALARAVARNNGARYYAPAGSNALSNEWASDLAEAVRSGRPFAARVRDGFLATDADSAELGHRTRQLFEELRRAGTFPVLVASGREGHRHLFVWLGPRLDAWAARARELGLDVRTWIRPPLTPHRLGLPVRLIDPSEPDQALAALRRPRRPLKGHTWERLRGGVPEGEDRSAAIQSVALAAFNAGWTFGQFRSAILDPANRLGEKVRAMESSDQDRWLGRTWEAARERYLSHPGSPSETSSAAVRRFTAAAETAAFEGRYGGLRKSLLGIAAIAARAGKLEVTFSDRQAAEAAGLDVKTFKKHRPRLEAEGWVERIETGRGRRASAYQLRVPVSHRAPTNHIPSKGGRVTNGGSLGHDAFRRSGTAGPAVLRMLDVSRPQGAAGIAAAIRVGRSTVHRWLRLLEGVGLACQERGGWVLVSDDEAAILAGLDALAEVRGTSGTARRQRARHGFERWVHRETRKVGARWVLTSTGEVFDSYAALRRHYDGVSRGVDPGVEGRVERTEVSSSEPAARSAA